MSDAIAALSEAMRNDAETLRVIGQNVSNIDTVAYRREIAVMRTSFDQAADEARAELGSPAELAAAAGLAAPAEFETAIDQRPGTLKASSEALHLALEGPGFFVVDTPQGEALTRRGDFRLDSEGRLVTRQGMPVLGENGAVHIAGTPQIAADGAVRVDGAVVGQLRVAQVAPGAPLSSLGADLYRGEQLPQGDSSARVRQGFLEASNVESVQEMIRLIETMRHFEGVQRFVRGYDDMMGKAISELGKV
jgi:flagellar basal-body rod protein FlgF